MEAWLFAKKNNCMVELMFNDKRIVVRPDADYYKLLDMYAKIVSLNESFMVG